MQSPTRYAFDVASKASTWLDLFIGLALTTAVIGGLMVVAAVVTNGGAGAIIRGLWATGAGLAPLPVLRFMQAHLLLSRALVEEVQALRTHAGDPRVILDEKVTLPGGRVGQ